MKAYPRQSSRLPQFTERLFNIAVIGRSAIFQRHNKIEVLVFLSKKAFLCFLDVFPFTQDTELTAEYDALRARQKREYAALSELKPRITTLNHIKYNFDILLRDNLPESREHQRDEPTER